MWKLFISLMLMFTGLMLLVGTILYVAFRFDIYLGMMLVGLLLFIIGSTIK